MLFDELVVRDPVPVPVGGVDGGVVVGNNPDANDNVEPVVEPVFDNKPAEAGGVVFPTFLTIL